MDLHEIEIAPDVLDLLPRMTHHLDEPIGDPAAINSYLICTAAREAGVKVMLSGMGADELFAGYRKHLANTLAPALPAGSGAGPGHGPCGGRPAAGRIGDPRVPLGALRQALPVLRRPPGGGARSGAATRCTTDPSCSACISPDLAGTVDDVLSEHARVYADSALRDHVNRMCLTDSRLFLPGLNLTYTDRSTMAASTEVRVPFVDVEVVKAAFADPR